ncbi:DotU family type IV/VI secretion system protein [Candidatus Hepatobacter penaei]|uniref:DotU family type IV/VI secretion system protein n=1 Tax=Candidatus Hepatobacter penaei TaxID=1274402 RepID=UPI0006986429|nr:DotU family type IV/VI secretion system protein [Candidatus Hepatobacter penaei]
MHRPKFFNDVPAPSHMTAHNTHFPYLVTFFQQFCIEIAKMKVTALSSKTHALKHVGSNTQHFLDVSPDPEAKDILDRLYYFLEEQSIEAKRIEGQFGESLYKEAQYIMAALADEIFLSLPSWQGRAFWEANLLEERLFHTHVAGEKFFENIDHFLQLKEPSRKDLAFLYLSALGLGFRGRYRGFDDQGKITHYKEELFFHLYQERPTLPDGHVSLFPDTLQFNISDILHENAVQQKKKTWRLIFAGMVALYIVVSYIIWYDTTNNLRRTVDMILDDVSSILER